VRDSDIRIRVLIENVRGAAGLSSQWGLSFWIETPHARLLFDCGESSAFLQNAQRLEEPIESADALILSHGHYDHGGGIHELAEVAPTARLVLHPAAVAPHYELRKGGKVDYIGMPDSSLAALRAAPERSVWVLGPTEVAPGAWVTGPVPRRHPLEEVEPTFFLDKACTIRDHVVDDQAMWIATPAGLVILCGCAHSGVMNIVRHVREAVAGRGVFGSAESRSRASSSMAAVAVRGAVAGVHHPLVPVASDGLPAVRALLGGMHLLQARKERLQATADYLASLDLELCAPCHCTGKRATALLRERLGGAFAEIVTGCELRVAYSS
jgi:7,8-dihydropterin-6-yl-methyl-4-(beta-D-ribofuranosyl)aminobenzene 5'-phosphate synthase